MTYTTPNNINVYKRSNLVQPKNADFSSGKLTLLDPKGNLSYYMPNLSDKPGSNYVNRTIKKIFFTIDNSDYIDLVIAKEIFVTFSIPATTATAFYDPLYLVANIALLLNVPPSMIKRADIVSANRVSIKRKRQLSEELIQLVVSIASDPLNSTDDTLLIEKNLLQLENIILYC